MPIEPPDSPRLADAAAAWFGAYIHIPFCRRVCPYCDFAVVGGAAGADRYVDCVLAEIEAASPFPEPLTAVHFGGGTPTSIEASALGRILGALRSRLGLAADAEVAIEANPEDIDPGSAAALAEAGFNRISLGVQSFDDAVLAALGRGHDSAAATSALEAALAVFDSVSVDLIFGTPGETAQSWRRSVEAALAAGIDHLSPYALTVERGTPLSRAVAGGAPAPDGDDQAEKWEAAVDRAQAAGMTLYETSNLAAPGSHSRYNLLTWAQGEYEAFGLGAHGHRDGRRWWNLQRLDRYLERVEKGAGATAGSERLGRWGREVERIMLGLRRRAGVHPGVAGGALVESPDGRRLLAAGVIGRRGDRLVVERPLLGDEVVRSLLAIEPVEC